MNLRKTLKVFATHCAYCGVKFVRYEDKTVDHVRPKSKHSKHTVLSNLVVCCRACNHRKDSIELEDYITPDIRTNLNIYLQRMYNLEVNGIRYVDELYKVFHKLL